MLGSGLSRISRGWRSVSSGVEICQLRGGDLSAQVGDRVYARVYDEDEVYWMHNNNRSPENEKLRPTFVSSAVVSA